MVERDPTCTSCKMHRSADVICKMGYGDFEADVMIVGKMPNSRKFQAELEGLLQEVGLDPGRIFYTHAIRCVNYEDSPSNGDVKTCTKLYLHGEMLERKPKFVLALGNEALLATTGKSGITKHRGKIFEDPQGWEIMATLSPSSVSRNPGQRPGFMADLLLFANRVKGIAQGIPKPNYAVIDNKSKLKALKQILDNTETLYFDVETYSDYYKRDGRIISLSATCEVRSDHGLKRFVFALPLYHPESPWRTTWRSVMGHLRPELEKIPKVVAHNGSYDVKWLRQLGIDIFCTFDTMLCLHLLDENVQKGLKPASQARLGVEPWGVDTRNLLSMPLDDVLEYNVLDTWYMYFLRKQIAKELAKDKRLLRIFKHVMMDAQSELVRAEMRGIYIDVDRLVERTPIVQAKLDEIEAGLDAYLPEEGPDDEAWPKIEKQLKTRLKVTPREKNYNAGIFARWFLFDWLELPILERGKDKDDGSPGDPSMAEDVLLQLRERAANGQIDEAQTQVVQLMLDRVVWNKLMSGFFKPYAELYDEDHRIHTNFKLAGTVTGRLSSGKSDEDKISVAKGKNRGVNLQQVPRDKLVRGLFGAPPGWYFVESDYSQVELRLAAFIARERTMISLFQQGTDLHSYIVHRVTGIPLSEVPKKLRKELGKPVNFGFIYGMGWAKFIETAFNNYGVRFTEEQAKGYRDMYFDAYPDLLPWHQKQRHLVRRFGRVQSPLGRIRHLPDIYSPDPKVQGEAERQAINSPVQSMGSDMAVVSMVAINREFRRRGLAAHCVGLVHDAVNYEIRADAVREALPIIKGTMEDVSLIERKFGCHIDVPIVADLKVGRHWGDATELTPEQVWDFDLSLVEDR